MSENKNYFDYSTYDIGNKNENTADDAVYRAADSTASNSEYSASRTMGTEDGQNVSGVYSNAYFEEVTQRNTTSEKNAYESNSYAETQNANLRRKDGKEKKVKKEKKGSGFFKKALVCICLGLFFGLFAGVGFYAVQLGTGMLVPGGEASEENVTDVLAEDAVKEPIPLNSTSNYTVVQSNVTEVAEKVMPAMVSIVNKYTVTSNFWGQTFSEQEASSGSGIIVGETDKELLIVSNNHVVEGAEVLEITFIDGSVAEARIKGLDSDMDLAVIAVSLEAVSEETMAAITIATLGNSDELKLGEPVIAIGNALGYGQSVTDGIVSALNREITMEDGTTGTFIQTNAAINPGNSGGALLNVNGEVVGINSSKIGGTAIEGMGYAIPITSASPIISDLMERQTRNKVAEDEVGYMGISLQEVTSQIAEMYNWPQGIYVLAVEEGSAAEKAGMLIGDIIVKFDGQKITSYAELQNVMQYFAAGDTAKVTVMRQEGGKYVQHDMEITLDKRPENLK